MADGSIKIDVGLNISKAERDLAKLREKIAKTEAQLNTDSARKTALETQIANVGAQADEATRKVIELKQQLGETSNRGEKATIRAALAEATEEQRILVRESNQLNDEYVKVSANIEKGNADLVEMQGEAGELSAQIAKARPGEMIAQSLEVAKKSIKTFLKYALGIRSLFILFRRLKSYIKESVQTVAEYDSELKKQLATLNATKTAIKGTFGSAFATIFQALLPIIQRVTNWILEAANATARFVAIVSGKDSYKRAVVDTEEVAASLEDTSEAADDVTDSVKEAKKQLMGFDELNILDNNESGSGSSGKTGSGKTDKTALDGIKFVEESLDTLDDSFLTKLALSVKDVLFDWTDLNPEQIAEKAISGLSMLLGGAVGFMIGGVPGAIVGTLLGLTLSLIANAAIFDHDGVLSRDEIGSMIRIALAGLCGGIIGFAVGGPGGALIGATIGVGFSLLAAAIEPKTGENGELGVIGTIVELLNYALPVAASTALGFVIGGPGGAAIGFILGIGISLMIAEVDTIPGGGKDLLQKMIKLLNNDTVRSGIEFLANPAGAMVNTIVRLSLKFKTSDDGELSQESREAGEEAGDSLQSGIETGITRNRRDWGAIFRNIFGSAHTEEATQTGNEIGKAVTDGEVAGLESGTQNVVTAATTMDNTVQDQMREDWDTGSPSKVTENLGKDIDAGLAGGFEAGTPDVVAAAHTMFEKIIAEMSDNLEKMKALMNFKWSIPKPAIPRISWSFSTVRYGKGQSVSVPQFFVNWYAKGGIFDFPQLIGVGENGKEAVVPLEKNTEWMAKIADGLMDRLTQANFVDQLATAFARTPMPAMAGGSVVPPKSVSGYSSSAGVEEAVRRGVSDALNIAAMGRQSEDRQPINIYIGDEKIASYIAKLNHRDSLITGGR